MLRGVQAQRAAHFDVSTRLKPHASNPARSACTNSGWPDSGSSTPHHYGFSVSEKQVPCCQAAPERCVSRGVDYASRLQLDSCISDTFRMQGLQIAFRCFDCQVSVKCLSHLRHVLDRRSRPLLEGPRPGFDRHQTIGLQLRFTRK